MKQKEIAPMRWKALVTLVLAALGAEIAFGEEPPDAKPNFQALKDDSSKSKELKKGSDLMKKYLKEERDQEEGRKGASLTKVEEARIEFRDWLSSTGVTLGVDLRANPRILVDLLNEARAELLRSAVKLKKGTIDEGSKPAPGYPRGRLDFNVLVSKNYAHNAPQPYPLVVTLHGRAINLRHPALRKDPQQRSRIVIYNNWAGDDKDNQLEAVVIAPTGVPDGFEYIEGSMALRQTLFLGAGVGCTDYMVDSQGMFVEVYGNAIRDAIEMSTYFAGVILRDREGATSPPLEGDDLTLLRNLNGKPFYYVADKAKWDTVGKPFADALKKIYDDAGKAANLTIETVERDANSALKADHEKMSKFLQNRLPDAQKELTWYFWNPSMVGPIPLLLGRANYDYNGSPNAEKMPLADKCGLIKMKSTLGKGVGKEGKAIDVNLLELEIYEAENAHVYLYEPLVDFDLPLTVKVNGKVVMEQEELKRDWNLFEKYCMSRKIFTFPIVGEIDLEFDFKPRVAPQPAPANANAGTGEGKETPKEGAPAEGAEKEAGTKNEGSAEKAAVTDK